MFPLQAVEVLPYLSSDKEDILESLEAFYGSRGAVMKRILDVVDEEEDTGDLGGMPETGEVSQLKDLAQKGIKKDTLLEAAIITPSCGIGTVNEKLADRALDLTRKVAFRLK